MKNWQAWRPSAMFLTIVTGRVCTVDIPRHDLTIGEQNFLSHGEREGRHLSHGGLLLVGLRFPSWTYAAAPPRRAQWFLSQHDWRFPPRGGTGRYRLPPRLGRDAPTSRFGAFCARHISAQANGHRNKIPERRL